MLEEIYMKRFERLADSFMLERLAPPAGKTDIVLDTDTYNEVDDQFALAYCLLAKDRINVEAVYAAPFLNSRSKDPGDGMEKSYNEILRVIDKLGMKGKVQTLKGSARFIETPGKPVESDAVTDLIERALKRKGTPLYVLAIGAPTNIASALLKEPAIRKNIVLVWLGGHPYYWPNSREFNCQQDIISSQVLFNSGVPFVNIPCKNVAEHLSTTIAELSQYLEKKSPIADYLYNIVKEYNTKGTAAWSKVIWDIATVAWIVNPEWMPTSLVHAPILTDQLTFSRDDSRHFIRVATHAKRDGIFGDIFRLLAGHK